MSYIAHSRLLREQKMGRKRVRERREGEGADEGGREKAADEGEGGCGVHCPPISM